MIERIDRMAILINSELGEISVNNNVIAQMAGAVATNCYGVVGMAVRSSKDGIAKLLKKENMDKGIKVRVSGDVIDVALFVIMEYGVNVGTVGDIIKSNVKYQIEEMTGLKVGSVTVNVESIRVN